MKQKLSQEKSLATNGVRLNAKVIISIISVGEIPAPRASQSCIIINNTNVLIHGGCDSNRDLLDAFSLDLRKKNIGIIRNNEMEKAMEIRK